MAPMRCANCGTELVGSFCRGCGQHVADADEFAIRPLARRLGSELIHLDFKSIRSVAALLVPGVLTLRVPRRQKASISESPQTVLPDGRAVLSRGAVRGLWPGRPAAAGPGWDVTGPCHLANAGARPGSGGLRRALRSRHHPCARDTAQVPRQLGLGPGPHRGT